MVKQQYTVEEAQSILPDLLDMMKPGEEVLLTKDGEIVAKLLRLATDHVGKTLPTPELGKGSNLHLSDDFDAH